MRRPALAMLVLALLTLACTLTKPTANLSGTAATITPRPSPAPLLFSTKPTPTPEPLTCQVIAAEALNVRSAPSIDGDVIGWLLPGDVASILSTRGAWYQVQSDRGAGFIHSAFCEVTNGFLGSTD